MLHSNKIMASFLTPNRHGYSIRFSPFNPNHLVVATSQYFGLAGGGTLFLLESNVEDKLVEARSFQWTDGLFDVVWSETEPPVVVTASGDCSLQIWNLLGKYINICAIVENYSILFL